MKFTTKGVQSEEQLIQGILDKVPEVRIWEKYLEFKIELNKKIISPVRSESDSLSSVFFIGSKGNILLKDFKTGKAYTVWTYLQAKKGWNLDTAVLSVKTDFHLLGVPEDLFSEKVSVIASNEVTEALKQPKLYTKILVKRKPWNLTELGYWQGYHFTPELLETLHIHPLSHYWIVKEKSTEFKAKKGELVFVFSFGGQKYKIYRPFADKNKDKWLNNCTVNTLMGEDSLEWIGKILIISKGMKELGCLRTLNYQSCSLQGENSFPGIQKIKTLKSRFEKIYSIMDIDDAGIQASKHLKERYSIQPIYLPKDAKIKDLAEYSKINGLLKVQQLIQQQL